MSSVIHQVFLGDDKLSKRKDQIRTIVEKAIRNPSVELEAILDDRLNPISMDQYQRVVGFLRQAGTPITSGELVYMNITLDRNSIRTTIHGDDAISDYCVENRLPEKGTTYLEKKTLRVKDGSIDIYSFKDDDVGYRMNLKTENKLKNENPMVRDLRSKWAGSRKTFRTIQRESFMIGKMFRVDCSRVRQGRGLTIQDSRCLETIPKYEIEIELLQDKIPDGMDTSDVIRSLLKQILRIMRVMRNTWFPLRKEQAKTLIGDYTSMIGARSDSVFIGPMPITLSRENLSVIWKGDYTATMKADGERALMVITKDGSTFFMYRTLRVEDTGIVVKKEDIRDTIIDGEVITKVKYTDPESGETKIIPKHPPLFLVFDCYRVNGENTHTLPLLESKTDGETRLQKASVIVEAMGDFTNYTVKYGADKHIPKIIRKKFVMVPADDTTETVLSGLNDEPTIYETDGIIFTPNYNSVNNCKVGDLVNIRGTWRDVMKWKPPEDNTVDFLLKISPEVKMSPSGETYKEGVLHVIGSEITPDILYDLQKRGFREASREIRSKQGKVVPFQGGDHMIQLEITKEGGIVSKSGEIVEDDMIVECVWNELKISFMDSRTGGWEIRNIRWDKTSAYKSGNIRGSMNSDQTASSVWKTSVSDRLSLESLWDKESSTSDEPDGGDQDVGGYFNTKGRREDSSLSRMRDFHNLYIKQYLISPGRRFTNGKRIVDLACGKGGDIHRYQKSGASFVVGIDIERDNILNPKDGAIRRYLDLRQRKTDMRFLLADCGKDIFASDTAGDEDSRKIIQELFGDRGIMRGGADKVVCMFAMHYFFKSIQTLDSFFTNVSKLLRPVTSGDTIPSCFVSCYFDADKVHKLMIEKGERDPTTGNKAYRSLDDKGDIAWSIEALYDVDSFEDAPEGVGNEIRVYISSINKVHNEYLVNRNTLRTACKEHGMTLVEDSSNSKKVGYKTSGTTFDKQYDAIPKASELGLLSYEKELSFLYRWDLFILSVR